MREIEIYRKKGFTTMLNNHLQDKNISLKACGLMARMLSLPPDWDYSINGLAAICKEGVKSIRAALKELEDAGYLVRTRVRDEKGHFNYKYTLFEDPEDAIPYTQKGHAVEGHAVEGHAQKDTQINTNKQNTNKQIVKKERKSSTYDEILNTLISDPKLKEALIEFIKMRKLSKKPLTDHALELLIKKLFKISSDPETQIEIVEQSITNNWQGFFPLKLEGSSKKVYSERGTSRDKQYKDFERFINFGSRSD